MIFTKLVYSQNWNRRIKNKEPTLAKAILKEKWKKWVHSFYNLSRLMHGINYSIVFVQKWWIEQWNNIENQEIYLCIYESSVYGRLRVSVQSENEGLFNKQYQEIVY